MANSEISINDKANKQDEQLTLNGTLMTKETTAAEEEVSIEKARVSVETDLALASILLKSY